MLGTKLLVMEAEGQEKLISAPTHFPKTHSAADLALHALTACKLGSIRLL